MNLIGAPDCRRSLIAALVAAAAMLAFAVGGYHAHDLFGAASGRPHIETGSDVVSGAAGCPACKLAHVSAPVPGPEEASPPEIVSSPATIVTLRPPVIAETRNVSCRAPPLHG